MYVNMASMIGPIEKNFSVFKNVDKTIEHTFMAGIYQNTDRMGINKNSGEIGKAVPRYNLVMRHDYDNYEFINSRFEFNGSTYRIAGEKYKGSDLTSHTLLTSILDRATICKVERQAFIKNEFGLNESTTEEIGRYYIVFDDRLVSSRNDDNGVISHDPSMAISFDVDVPIRENDVITREADGDKFVVGYITKNSHVRTCEAGAFTFRK